MRPSSRKFRMSMFVVLGLFLGTGFAVNHSLSAADGPIAIADVQRDTPVDFEKEVLPILRKKCLACHNTTKAESQLILEHPQAILKGGALGPSAEPGKGADSLLIKMAARQEEPFMPPDGNKVSAERLTPEELGLIRLWINQGAKGEVMSSNVIQWQPLPPGVNPVYAVAVSPDGQYAAAGRANQIFVFHVPTKRELGRLTDPTLLSSGIYSKPGVADLDMIQSLRFSPNGEWLASGGYRTAKLWHRPQSVKIADVAGLESPAHVAVVSPDGKLLATGEQNGKIKLIDLASRQIVRTLAGHTAPVTALSFTPDTAQLVSASKDKSWRVWRVADGAALARVDTPAEINSAALLMKGGQLATGGQDNLLRIWSLAGIDSPALPATTAPITALASSVDKKWLALASADGKVVLFDVMQKAAARTLEAHPGGVIQVAFNAANNRLTTVGADGKVRVWDPATGQNLIQVSTGTVQLSAASINPAGNQLAAGAVDGTVRSWKLDVPEARALAGDNGIATAVGAVSHDRKLLATAGVVDGKQVVVLREIASGNVVRHFAGHEAPITSVAFSLDGTRLISGSEDKTARVWNVADAQELNKLSEHNGAVVQVALNSNGQQALTVAADNAMAAWNLADAGKKLYQLAGHSAAVTGVSYSNDNQSIVTASADKSVRWWNAADGQQARTIDLGTEATTLALSADGQRLAVGGADNQVRLVQFGDGQVTSTLAGLTAPAKFVSFTPDGARVLSASGQQTAVWQTADGRILEDVSLEATFVKFATDNQTFVAGHADKSLKVHTMRIERLIGDHAKRISGLAFTVDGQAILTGSEDGTARRFTAANGQQAFSANHGAPIHALAVSPNGQWLASAGEDKQIKIFNAANGGAAPKPQFGGFAGPVKAVAFSLDNNKVAGTDGGLNQVLAFDLMDGTVDQVYAEHAAPAGSLAAIAIGDQASLMVSATDAQAKVWKLVAGKKIAGHPQPINSVAAINDTQILTGCADGNARHWETSNGQMVRQMAHGGPIEQVAVRPDGQRFVSTAANNTIKLWNAANGQQVAELKGDFRSQIRVTDLTRAVALAKRKVDLANADLKAAQDRKAAEEKNAMMVAEAKKKAEEDLTKKTEAAKQPVADKEAAEKALADATAAQTKAEEGVKAADENLKKVTEALPVAQKELEAANKAAADAANVAKQAAEKLAKAEEAAKADANNADLAEAVKAAAKEAEEAEAKNKAAAEAKVAAEKKVAEADAAKKAGEEGKKKADQDLATAKTAFTQAEAKVKQVTPVAQKAVDEMTAAERALQAAARSVERSNAAVQKVAEEIPVQEKVVAQETEAHKASEAALEEGKKQAAATESPVRRAAFSLDGKSLFTGGEDQLVHSWDAETGVAIEIFTGHNAPITALAPLPDGNLFSAAANNTAIIWNTAPEWTLARTIGSIDDPGQLIDRVTALDFSPDGKLLATGSGEPSRSGQVKIWNPATGELIRELKDPHSDTVLGLEFSPDSQFIASSGADRFAKVFQVSDGKFIRAFEGHTHHVLGVSWRADGRLLATAGADNVIKVWNTRTGDQERTIQGFGKEVTSLKFVAEGDTVIASSGDNGVRMKNAANGGNVRDFGGSTDFVYSVSASADGKFIIAGGQDSTVRVWTGDNGQLFVAFETPKPAAN